MMVNLNTNTTFLFQHAQGQVHKEMVSQFGAEDLDWLAQSNDLNLI